MASGGLSLSSNGNGHHPCLGGGSDWDPNYEEVVVTIKKSERGFGFELRNGILIVAVYPSKPEFITTLHL
jgi:hypothetical protein